MKKTTWILLVVMLTGWSFSFQVNDVNTDKEDIKIVIAEGYIKGLFQKVDLDLIEKYWHKDCDTVRFDKGMIKKDNMGMRLEMAKKSGQLPPAVPNARHTIDLIDVTGNAAVAKVNVYFGDVQIFTDYFSLYKFADGWKIVTKIWYQYNNKK